MAYWRRVLRHRFSIAGLSVVCGLLAVLVTSSLEPLYGAEATLLADTQGEGLDPVQDGRDGGRVSSSASHTSMQTQILLLRSRTLAESVTDRLRLWDAPELDPRQVESRRAQASLDWTALVPGFFPHPASAPPPTEEQARAATIAAVGSRLKAEPCPDSQVIRLSFTAHDPRLAARVVNAFAEAYVAMGRPTGQQPMGKAASSADGNGAPDLTGRQIQMLFQRLGEARARNDDLQELHDQMQRAGTLSTADLIAHPILASNITLQSLKSSELQADRQVSELAKRYGPMHPSMVAARSELDAVRSMLTAEIGNAVAGLAQELDTGRTQAAKLEGELAALQAKPEDTSPSESDPRSVGPDVETGRGLSDRFLAHPDDTAPGFGMAAAHARIIDAAQVPESPVEPNATKLVGGAALLGLVAGLAIAMLSAYRDNTLKDPQDVEDNVQVPTLGRVPPLSRRRRDTTAVGRMFADQPASPFAEAIRTLRTGVVLASRDGSRGVVLVTSSVAGEGTTTVALNLALALGQLDKVLLIDADLRRASAPGMLGLPTDARGLSDLVAGTAEESACIHRIDGLQIAVLPAGAAPPAPLELLSSRQFAQTLERLRERYAWMVIDSTAVQAASDTLMLARASDAVVLVIRASETPLPLVQTTVKRLRQVGAPLIGAVLNGDANA